MRLSPYVIVTIIIFVVYVYSAIQCGELLSKIQAKGHPASWPWSNRKKYNIIKLLYNETKDMELHNHIKHYLFYINLGEYAIFIGVALFVILLIVGIN